MSDIAVQRLTEKDYDPMLEVWRKAGLSTLRTRGRDSREAFARQLSSVLLTALGFTLDGQLAGVVLVSHDGRKGWINRLAIDPRHRRQGLAGRLVSAAEEVLREQGIEVYAALVENDNVASWRLFLGLGYEEVDPGIHYLSKRTSPEA